MKNIQMVDLKGQYNKIKDQIDTTVIQTIESTSFINGPVVKKFSNLVVKNVIKSKFIKGAKEFLNTNYNYFNFFLCTSTPQKEIQKILNKKNINHFFKKIYGSPINKVQQINNIIQQFDNNTIIIMIMILYYSYYYFYYYFYYFYYYYYY